MRSAGAVLVLALSVTPAELADPASAAELGFGRYAYLSQGTDIPLAPVEAEPT